MQFFTEKKGIHFHLRGSLNTFVFQPVVEPSNKGEDPSIIADLQCRRVLKSKFNFKIYSSKVRTLYYIKLTKKNLMVCHQNYLQVYHMAKECSQLKRLTNENLVENIIKPIAFHMCIQCKKHQHLLYHSQPIEKHKKISIFFLLLLFQNYHSYNSCPHPCFLINMSPGIITIDKDSLQLMCFYKCYNL